MKTSISSLLLFALAARAEMPARYTVTDLGTLGGAASRAYAINNDGVVAGEAETAGRRIHAFIWKRGQGITDLGTLGGPTSRAYDINSNGMVVGEADTTSGLRVAFVWSAEAGMTNLGVALRPFASFAYAINDSGLIAGGARSGLSVQLSTICGCGLSAWSLEKSVS